MDAGTDILSRDRSGCIGHLITHLERGIRVEVANDYAEGQLRVLDFFPWNEARVGNGDNIVEIRICYIDDRELVFTVAFRVIFGLSLIEAHLEFFLPDAGKDFAHEQQHQT